jgi:hypothetical protein
MAARSCLNRTWHCESEILKFCHIFRGVLGNKDAILIPAKMRNAKEKERPFTYLLAKFIHF